MSTSRISSPHGDLGDRRHREVLRRPCRGGGRVTDVVRNSPLPPGSRLVTVRTDDGVDLAGIVLPATGPASGRPLTFVLAHGFTGSVDRAPFRRVAGWLR